MDDDYESGTSSHPATPKLSKTPSWITLGFILGALFVWWLPREEMRTPAPPPARTVHLERPKETEIEAVFADWGHYAVWENDLTEVALWDPAQSAYAICYEVLRTGDLYYFRSIPHLTRPVLTHGVRADSPLQFTEPEAAHREWLRHVQFESLTGKRVPPDSN
jgi:hypothetical protein